MPPATELLDSRIELSIILAWAVQIIGNQVRYTNLLSKRLLDAFFYQDARPQGNFGRAFLLPLTGSDTPYRRCRDWGRDGLCGSQAKRLPSWPGPSASGWRPYRSVAQRQRTCFGSRWSRVRSPPLRPQFSHRVILYFPRWHPRRSSDQTAWIWGHSSAGRAPSLHGGEAGSSPAGSTKTEGWQSG